MRPILIVALLVFGSSLILQPVAAQTQPVQWKSLDGPWYASYANDISIGYRGNQRIIYVADSSANSLLKSTDEGVSWLHLPIAHPEAVACVRDKPDTVYVGVTGRGLFKSTNGGRSFDTINNGFVSTLPRKIAISPHNENLIYVGCWTWPTLQPTLYRSTNSGGQWIAVEPFHNNSLAVTDIVFHPTSPDTIWVSGLDFSQPDDSGVWLSTNGGVTWRRRVDGMDKTQIGAVVPEPNHPTVLYAGTRYTDVGNRLYKTTNGGERWEQVHSQPFPVWDAAVSSTRETVVFFATSDGILKTQDGGLSWNWHNEGMFDRYTLSLAVDFREHGVLYAGTWASFYRSADAATTWHERTRGIELVRTTDVHLAGNSLFTISNNPLHAASVVNRSMDGGIRWSVMLRNEENNDVYHFSGRCITRDSNVILAGGARQTEEKYIIRSSDGGLNWTSVLRHGYNSSRRLHINEIEFDPSDSRIVFAVGDYEDQFPTTIYRSEDRGLSWPAIYSSAADLSTVEIHPSSGLPSQVIYAGGRQVGVIKSVDAGNSWISTALSGVDVFSLASNPNTPEVLYAGTSSGIYKTTNAGAHWSSLTNSPQTKIGWLLAHPVTSGTAYALAPEQRKVYRTTDAGTTWNELSGGLPQTTVHRVDLDAGNPNAIYAATDSGVYSIPHVWTGEVEADVTWKSGETYLVDGFLSIIAGKTLTIESGATVELAGGAGIIAEGALVAEGARFAAMRNSNSRWYGVVIKDAESSVLRNCTFLDAQYGVLFEQTGVEKRAPALFDCTFSGCAVGVYLYGNLCDAPERGIRGNHFADCKIGLAVYQGNDSYDIQIDNNSFAHNDVTGMSIARARPVLHRNTVGGTEGTGVSCWDNGNAEFGEYVLGGRPGENTVANNRDLQLSAVFASPFLGLVTNAKECDGIAGGLNRLFHNDDRVIRLKVRGAGAHVQADKNFWGWPVRDDWFIKEEDGTYSVLCPLRPEPAAEEQLLLQAAASRAAGDYYAAIDAYSTVAEEYPLTPQAAAAITGAADTYGDAIKATGDTTLQQEKQAFLEDQAANHPNPGAKIAANLRLAWEYEKKGGWQAAQDAYAELLQNTSDADLKAIVFRNLVHLYAAYYQNLDQARQTLQQMAGEVANHELVELAKLDLAIFTRETLPAPIRSSAWSAYAQQNRDKSQTPSRYSLEQNFPNPFNPTTEIWFKLGADGYITLRLYDVLGREIKTLAEGNYEAGYHNITVDASGMSSGVYFYRLTTSQYTSVRKMLVAK